MFWLGIAYNPTMSGYVYNSNRNSLLDPTLFTIHDSIQIYDPNRIGGQCLVVAEASNTFLDSVNCTATNSFFCESV